MAVEVSALFFFLSFYVLHCKLTVAIKLIVLKENGKHT